MRPRSSDDRPTLLERTLRSRAEVGPAPGPAPGPAAGPPTEEVSTARHCWVTGLPDTPGRWPGLLAEWARRDGGWQGRVVYAVDDGGSAVLVEAWVAARHLQPH